VHSPPSWKQFLQAREYRVVLATPRCQMAVAFRLWTIAGTFRELTGIYSATVLTLLQRSKYE